eukprot:10194896-Alexandrium_andersonii.AAC.1
MSWPTDWDDASGANGRTTGHPSARRCPPACPPPAAADSRAEPTVEACGPCSRPGAETEGRRRA